MCAKKYDLILDVAKRLHELRYICGYGRFYHAIVEFINLHIVTVYNTSDEDPVTFEKTTHITVLRGVFYDAAKAVNVRESGLTNADSVNLIIPWNVEAVDGVTREPQTYLSPKKYATEANKSKHWTIKTSDCFFVKGEVVRPGSNFQAINKAFDYVHNVTTVDEKDYGNLRHWEIGGA